MNYRFFLILFTLLFTDLQADDLDRLTPPLTKEMKANEANATLCNRPAMAQEKFGESFRYGCFCGEAYPNIQHPSQKNYKELNQKEKEELITQYYGMKPYDSIDQACMQHDICYINKQRKDQSCNDALYKRLRTIKKYFNNQPNERKSDSKERRCSQLSSDMASVFKTIFATGDNISMIRFGTLSMTTPMTIATTTIEQSSRTLHDGEEYPLRDERCLVEELNTSKF